MEAHWEEESRLKAAMYEQALEQIYDDIVHERGPLSNMGLTSDQINAVLAVIENAWPEGDTHEQTG